VRILIDGMNLALEQGTGVATYARMLAACIRREGHEVCVLYGRDMPAHADPALREAAFFDAAEAPRRSRLRQWGDFLRGLRPVTPVTITATGAVLRPPGDPRFPEGATLLNHRSLFQQALSRFRNGMGFLEVAVPADVAVAHWTFPMPVRAINAPNVYTIHDLVPLKLPYATLDSKPFHHRLLGEIARSADAIATVSEASRDDILDLLPIAPGKVVNTSQAVAPPDLCGAEDAAGDAVALTRFAERRGPDGATCALFAPQGYFLFVGAIEPKKNVGRIIEAHHASGVEAPLVIAGRRGWLCDAEMRAIARSPRIVHLDYVSRSELALLMRQCRALLFPSLYEGFGLPVVEAFLSGAPVIGSTVGACAEIAGDAAMLVDPYDIAALRAAILAFDAPDWPTLRADYAARGRRRAEAFSVGRVAPGLAAFHADVAARRLL